MPSVKRLLPIKASDEVEDPSQTENSHYVISNHNRWSRAVLTFEGLENDTWCELNFHADYDMHERSRAAHDFAVIGFDFLMEDGSSIDFTDVPGLARSQIDPHSRHMEGPEYQSDCSGPVQSSRISCTFFMPSPARGLAVTIRSWRNSHPFVIREPTLVQPVRSASSDVSGTGEPDELRNVGAFNPITPRRTWRPLTTEPSWFSYAVVPQNRLLIRGQIVNENRGTEGALARIIYRNAKGEALPPPYTDAAAAPSVGAFIDIPVHRQARRFTLDLLPPSASASVEIGFRAWSDQAGLELVLPLEVSLDDELLLENVSGDGSPDAQTFLARTLRKLGLDIAGQPEAAAFEPFIDIEALRSPFTFHSRLDAVQWGPGAPTGGDDLTIRSFPAWRLPEVPQWTEDPFQSVAWRLRFQSLSWLQDLPAEAKSGGLSRAVDLATSWSQANAWGAPKDPVSTHPLSLSVRAEVLLSLLSSSVGPGSSISRERMPSLYAEAVRHAFALSQLVGQNVFVHSAAHIHASCALLATGRALPAFPLAPYWTSLALAQLEEGFDRLFNQHGVSPEQSQHFRLETVSLGLILASLLESMPETEAFRSSLISRLGKSLRSLVAVTDPSGALPPFGDAPQGYHHASWLRRLISVYGTTLLSDPDLASELAYPIGLKTFASSEEGIVTARHYNRTANWSYFCASLSGHRSEHGHSDCTSFVYSTDGKGWIVDPRGSDFYETGAARQFLVSPRAHNIAIPDGREPTAGTGWIEARETLTGASLFQIGTNVHGYDYDHHRIIICLDDLQAIAVFDQFAAGEEPMSFEGFLHFDTGITAALVNQRLGVGYRKDGRLQIIPQSIKGQFGGMSIDIGRSDKPATVQGFVAQPAGGLQAANVLRYRFSGSGTVCGGVLLAASEQAAGALANLLESATCKEFFQRIAFSTP